ncbi:MAG TPA: arsenate reductase ArsC [Clostridia bacterium]|nr:arsenate reductase ArsC [Clostridia bacterium]
MHKPNVAFICVHNSCRSQMAEAIAKVLAPGVFNAFSAGTEAAERINPDAVQVIKELYRVDMDQTQKPKPLQSLPPIDILVTMGCNVHCPDFPAKYREDWELEDPTGKPKAEFIKTAKLIEGKVKDLMARVQEGSFIKCEGFKSS